MKVEILLGKKKAANVLVVAVCYDLRFPGCILRRDLSYYTLNHLILKDLLAQLDTVRIVDCSSWRQYPFQNSNVPRPHLKNTFMADEIS